MAQLGSTVVHGALSVTDNISAGAVYSNGTQCLTAAITSLTTAASGSGNVISDITVSGNTITKVKGITALTAETQLSTGTSGSGNVVTSISVSNHKITYNKDLTALTGITKTQVTAALGYTPPTTNTTYSAATTTYAGLVKVGNNISIDSSGIISPTKTGVTAALGYTPPTTNTTYSAATTTYAGLVSTAAQTFGGAKTFNTGVSATSFTATSSRKAKKDISPSLISALDIIKDTEIVDFKYINDTENIPHVGFIAEDTPEILSTPRKTQMDMVNCIGVLMKAVQEITKGTEALEKRIKELETI